MSALTDSIIVRQEALLGVRLDYLRSIADVSLIAFTKFGAAMPLAQHRKETPLTVWHLARLAATRVQDCGTCVQIVVNGARAAGVPAATLRAALDGDVEVMAPGERLAVRYGEAVASRSASAGVVIEEVRQSLGEAVLVELALAVATVQIFPILKRGLGQAVACSLIQVDV